ncbi:MAG: DNA polymerase III subunit alpha [Spirochaetaceae bacterium]|jgi:DNA polymerase-3 subunit alpha|nr:DNA polymerase III subunit alpha [Spirochaetaceae bacterium]
MEMTDFVHLHVHSDFSLLDGAASVDALAKKAAALGMKHLAITDHGNMFGVIKFAEACRGSADHPLPEGRAAVNPIIGCEFYMAPGSRHERKGSENGNKYYHLVLLAASGAGYRNLVRLSSYSYTEGFYYKPRIDRELLERYHEGLIGLSACIAGEIPALYLEGKDGQAEALAFWFRDLFGPDNFYLELQDHGIAEQKKANAALIALSRKTGIPLVVTNDIHYLEKDDAETQDIMLCVGTQAKRNDEKRMRFEGREFYFKTGDEMAALFPDCPGALSNTVKIAERCAAVIPAPGALLPDFEIPDGFAGADEYLRHLTREGLARRYPREKALAEGLALDGAPWREIAVRAEYELDVIIRMGFTGYFLIVADFINWAKERGIPVGPGRGSGAGSIVAYALRITDLDPLKYQLLFERFLNPERISMPDFDVDFANEGRGDVIRYVTEKYGADRVGQIITFGTLKARAAVKDVARVLDISLDESNMIAKLIGDDPKITLKKAFEQEPRLRELEQEGRFTELFAFARKLEGKNRNTGLHAAGIVIGKTALIDYVPLYRDKDGVIASQYPYEVIEPLGLVKMDFLGLKTLDLIKNTGDLIRRRGGACADFDIEKIPEDDAATFKMLGEGKSAGVFQFESEGMRNILKQARPETIEELIALNALYRPGPMDNIQKFIDSKWGRQRISYPDPSLAGILKETYGVFVYQEQVMEAARIIAGYSLGEADLLRRAMGKKKMETMVKEKKKFIAGAVTRGYRAEDAGRIFEELVPFAGYGFNKSHAAAYAVLAYQTAYLKANFPVEFMAANLTNEINSVDKLPQYIDEARRMGIAIDPPDVNHSDKYFTVVNGRIVYGFLGIKGVGHGPAEEIVRCREEAGPFRDFSDFLDRVDLKSVGKRVTEPLIRAGAFDSLRVSRSTLMGNLERALEYAGNKKEDRKFGQGGLFEDTDEKTYPDFVFEDFPPWDRMEQLEAEKELIGFYFSGHPLDDYREVWEQNAGLNLARLPVGADGEYVIVGIVNSLKPITDKKGNLMAFGSLADYTGEIDLTFFAKVWKNFRDDVSVESRAAFRGRLDTSRAKPSFIVSQVMDLEKMRKKALRLAEEGRAEMSAAAKAFQAGGAAAAPSGPEHIPPGGGGSSPAMTPPAETAFRELHIRIAPACVVRDEDLYPLRDCLIENPGPCAVFIHIGETEIRAASRITAAADTAVFEPLKHRGIVAAVWAA